nr:hypothetical protein [Tanacetum cinerariifolium]
RYTRRAIRIAQSKALSHAADEPASLLRDDRQGEAFPTVSSLDGSMQQRLQELMELCTSFQRQQTQMAAKIKDQNLEISGLKARVKFLEDKDRGSAEPTQEDALIKGEIMKIGEEVRSEKSIELGRNDTDEMVNVLSSMEAANILTSGVAAVSVSFVAGVSTKGVPTVSGLFPTASVIFTTASVVTPYIRRSRGISAIDKGKEKVVESESKPLSKKEQREFYMSVLRSHAGWKTKHFRGMTLEEIKEKFIPIWKQLEDFVPMSSKEEGERVKRQGLKIEQGSSKRMKTSEGVSKEDLKGMMQLVPLEEVYVEALQVKHPIIDWEIHSKGKREEDLHQLWTLVKETLSIKQATKDKEKELWVEPKRLQQTQMAAKIKDQNLEISGLKARVKFLKDKDRGSVEPTQEDAPIKGGIMETGEEVRADKSTELGSNDTDEMVNVLSSMKAANILTSEVVAVSVSFVAGVSTKGVPTVSGLFPTTSVIFTTASMVTPYTIRSRGILATDKGKEKVVESEVPKKRKLQEQIDAQVAREMEEEFTRENQRVNEQLARDLEIARLHAEEEIKMMIEGLDRSNEVIVKHLQEYEQVTADLSVGEKIELINELVKYQDHHTKILKYQAQQSKPLSKKEQREFHMSVLRSHAGWKTKHFRGMTLEEIKEKFIPIWKQLEDFVPMSSKEEGKRVKRQGLKIEQRSSKRMKTSKGVSKEDLKGMMQLVPLEEVYVEALQVKHPIIDWEIHSEGKREEDLHQLWTLVKETLSIKHATKDKEKELWVELKRLYEPDFEDQLWTRNQALMHDHLEWKLYDTCGVHHVFTKDQEIFMLVEKDYPLRRGLATMMICNKLQVEQYSQMANDLILKIHNIANSLR